MYGHDAEKPRPSLYTKYFVIHIFTFRSIPTFSPMLLILTIPMILNSKTSIYY